MSVPMDRARTHWHGTASVDIGWHDRVALALLRQHESSSGNTGRTVLLTLSMWHEDRYTDG